MDKKTIAVAVIGLLSLIVSAVSILTVVFYGIKAIVTGEPYAGSELWLWVLAVSMGVSLVAGDLIKSIKNG